MQIIDITSSAQEDSNSLPLSVTPEALVNSEAGKPFSEVVNARVSQALGTSISEPVWNRYIDSRLKQFVSRSHDT